MLNIGDKVYMAGYGEGEVKKIKLNAICGKIQKSYYISLVSDNIDFFIPEYLLKKYRIKKSGKEKNREDKLTFIGFIRTRMYKKCGKNFGVMIKGVEIK